MTLLTGSQQQPNEAHDCQRLVVRQNFGPLVGIFPVTATVALDAPSAFDSARVIASIYNWGGGDAEESYGPLRIPRGWSCLWLVRDSQPNGPSQWDAAIVRAPSQNGCLHGGPVPLPDTQYLDVHRRLHSDTVPRTGRWAWDDRRNAPGTPVLSEDGQHYIGIKCADGWCSIGANGFQPRPATGALVPGWLDEQHLAVPGSDGRLVPGPWGRIAPYPAPRHWEVPAFVWGSNSGGQRIGTVTLEGTPEQHAYYTNKRRLDAGGKTDLWLFKTDTGDENTGWQMLMVTHDPRNSPPRPSLGSGTVVGVSRIAGVLHATPGAVRWRWSDTDEATWSGCGKACCTPQT